MQPTRSETRIVSPRILWVMLIHALPTVGLLLQGSLYVTTSKFMPYHAEALGVAWEELSASYQGFVLGVVRAMGAGSVSVSLALLLLLGIPLRRGEAWVLWAVPLIGIIFTLLTAYAAYTIDVRTPAATPWRQTCGLAAFYALCGVVSYWPRRSREASA